MLCEKRYGQVITTEPCPGGTALDSNGGAMKQLIYIAEDEKNIRETLQRFLENDGYEVCAFETGDALLGALF